MNVNPLDAINLGSISGIIVATMIIVEVLKRALGNVAFFQKIPIFMYAGAISVLLAFLANKVIKGDDGVPILQGEFYKIAWAALIAALGASGFYSWLRPVTPEVAMRNKSNIDINQRTLILILPLLLLVGCKSCPEKAILREGVDQVTRTIREQHLNWTDRLVADPAKRAELPILTPAQVEQAHKTHQEYTDLINDDRKNDAGVLP